MTGNQGTSPTIDSSIYRRVFVGREAELQRLVSTYERAVGGEGSLAMVAGEPGIGKTAPCEQLTAYVQARDGTTLLGHCYEEGSLSLPYLPFVEALQDYISTHDTEAIRAVLGTGASDVARIVPLMRERLQG
jgi:predicted ATPase